MKGKEMETYPDSIKFGVCYKRKSHKEKLPDINPYQDFINNLYQQLFEKYYGDIPLEELQGRNKRQERQNRRRIFYRQLRSTKTAMEARLEQSFKEKLILVKRHCVIQKAI